MKQAICILIFFFNLNIINAQQQVPREAAHSIEPIETVKQYAELKIVYFKNNYTGTLFTGESSKLVDDNNMVLKRRGEVMKSEDPMEILNFVASHGWKVNVFFFDGDDKRYYLLYK